ncbi:MAG TPA: hypothetical protein VEA79_07685, partial [Phenylobacterium sp.]|nr:hypothetical protein [Phenylobacterium sp.]
MIGLLLALAFSGQAAPPFVAEAAPAARAALEEHLRDYPGARLRAVTAHPITVGAAQEVVFCGDINAPTADGG